MNTVPVFDTDGKTPLMPTTPSRARRWVKEKKATFFWKKGIFCVRLNQEPSGKETQEIVVGIDPGAKYSGMSIKSASKTYFNVQYDAIDWVKDRCKDTAAMRYDRRRRKTPYKACRFNRSSSFTIGPSVKARWQQHVNLVKFFMTLLPISRIAVEDVAAVKKKGANKWNRAFSTVEHGKQYLYKNLYSLKLKVNIYSGFDTYTLRQGYGLKKSRDKSSQTFNTHAVDAWVLANEVSGGHTDVDNKELLVLKPFSFYRRKLHYQTFRKGHIRPPYGGTDSLGLKRGTLVSHKKHGIVIVGGKSIPNQRVTVHSLDTNKRLAQNIKVGDLKILTNMKWNMYVIKDTKVRKGVSELINN